jgi:hypothetical protein
VTQPGPILVCPLCRGTVSVGLEPSPGECPHCAARYGGGGDDARGGVAAALAQWGIEDVDSERVAAGLFSLVPGEPLDRSIAVTSDRRAGFYKWWVFVASDVDLHATLMSVAARDAR